MDIGTLIVGLVALLFGAAFCFAGFRYFRYLVSIWGVIAGFWIAEAFIAALLGDSNTAIIIGWIAGLIGAVVLAWLAFRYLRAAVLILGATFGIWLVATLLPRLGMESSLLIAILAILGGILFAILILQETIGRFLIIIFTALLGATGIVVGLLFLFGPLTVDIFRAGLAPLLPSILQQTWIAALLWIVLAVLGAAIQWLSGREAEVENQYEPKAGGSDEAPDFDDEDEETFEETASDWPDADSGSAESWEEIATAVQEDTDEL